MRTSLEPFAATQLQETRFATVTSFVNTSFPSSSSNDTSDCRTGKFVPSQSTFVAPITNDFTPCGNDITALPEESRTQPVMRTDSQLSATTVSVASAVNRRLSFRGNVPSATVPDSFSSASPAISRRLFERLFSSVTSNIPLSGTVNSAAHNIMGAKNIAAMAPIELLFTRLLLCTVFIDNLQLFIVIYQIQDCARLYTRA